MKTDGSDQNTKGGTARLSEEENARKTMQADIARMAGEFERALPGKIGVERMMRIVMTAILKTPRLAQCEPTSFMGALLQALQLGLEVNTPLGQAYLIPRARKDYNGKFSHWECNFQLGYQGMLDLCYRYGKYKMITAEVVRDGDFFDYRLGTKQYLDHQPKYTKDAKPTHVWALYELENGGSRFVVWTWEEAMAHGEEFSDSFNREKTWASPWLSNETSQEEMAKKSVLKALLKYAPKSVEGHIEAAAYADGHAVIASREGDGNNMKLSFDVKQLPPPDPEMQDLMNKINSPGRKTEDAQTVPSGGKNGRAAAPPASGSARAQTGETGNGRAPAGGAAAQEAVQAPGSGGGLFSKDEEDAFEEQHRQQSGPDWDD